MKPFLAIDCGAANLKVALFEPQPNGALVLQRYEVASLGQRGLEEVERSGLLTEVLKDVVDRHEIRAKGMEAYICTPSYQSFTKFLSAPAVDGKKVGQIITYEAAENVPFPLDEVEWGYQIMGNTEEGDLDVMLMALKHDVIESLSKVCTDLSLKLSVVDGAPPALRNAFMHNYGELEGCSMLVDIGAKTTNVIFIEEGNFFSRSINFGANSITQEFARESNLEWQQADDYKQAYGYVHLTNTAEPTDPYQAIVVRTARQVMMRLHQQIEQTRQFYVTQRKGQQPQRLFLAGGGSSMHYIAEFFQEKFDQLPIEFFNPFRNIELGPEVDRADLASKAHSMGELAGLGLRSTSVGLTEFNLLPNSEKVSRQIENRSPYVIAMIFCLGLIPFAFGFYYKTISAEKDKAKAELESQLDRHASTARQMVSAKNDLAARKADTEQMKGLLQTRFLWIDIVKAVQEVFTEVTPEVYLVSGPNEIHLATNTVADLQAKLSPKSITNAVTAIWIESLTTTAPATMGPAGAGSMEGMSGMGGAPPGAMGGAPPGMASGGGGPPGMNMGGGPGMGMGMGGEGGSATVAEAKDVEYIYLKLRAKNILPRERETLNQEFALMLADRFREHPIFSDELNTESESEEFLTRVTGKIPPGDSKDRWFEFTVQLKLTTPIKMQSKDEEEE